MGEAATQIKLRICKSCGNSHYTDAKGIAEHQRICVRIKALGLDVPGITAVSLEP